MEPGVAGPHEGAHSSSSLMKKLKGSYAGGECSTPDNMDFTSQKKVNSPSFSSFVESSSSSPLKRSKKRVRGSTVLGTVLSSDNSGSEAKRRHDSESCESLKVNVSEECITVTKPEQYGKLEYQRLKELTIENVFNLYDMLQRRWSRVRCLTQREEKRMAASKAIDNPPIYLQSMSRDKERYYCLVRGCSSFSNDLDRHFKECHPGIKKEAYPELAQLCREIGSASLFTLPEFVTNEMQLNCGQLLSLTRERIEVESPAEVYGAEEACGAEEPKHDWQLELQKLRDMTIEEVCKDFDKLEEKWDRIRTITQEEEVLNSKLSTHQQENQVYKKTNKRLNMHFCFVRGCNGYVCNIKLHIKVQHTFVERSLVDELGNLFIEMTKTRNITIADRISTAIAKVQKTYAEKLILQRNHARVDPLEECEARPVKVAKRIQERPIYECTLCGRETRRLHHHLRFMHNIDEEQLEQYVKETKILKDVRNKQKVKPALIERFTSDQKLKNIYYWSDQFFIYVREKLSLNAYAPDRYRMNLVEYLDFLCRSKGKEDLTFTELYEEWIDMCGPKKWLEAVLKKREPGTVRRYLQSLRHFATFLAENISFAEGLTKDMADEMFNQCNVALASLGKDLYKEKLAERKMTVSKDDARIFLTNTDMLVKEMAKYTPYSIMKKKDAVECRDVLLARILMRASPNPQKLLDFKISKFLKTPELSQDKQWFLYPASKKKSKGFGQRYCLVINKEDFDAVGGYLRACRPLLTKDSDREGPLFPNCFDLRTQIQHVWKKFTPAILHNVVFTAKGLRKGIVSNAVSTKSLVKDNLALILTHSARTAALFHDSNILVKAEKVAKGLLNTHHHKCIGILKRKQDQMEDEVLNDSINEMKQVCEREGRKKMKKDEKEKKKREKGKGN